MECNKNLRVLPEIFVISNGTPVVINVHVIGSVSVTKRVCNNSLKVLSSDIEIEFDTTKLSITGACQ